MPEERIAVCPECYEPWEYGGLCDDCYEQLVADARLYNALGDRYES